MEYHISRGGETFGPYPEEQVKQMLEEGLLLPSDFCWTADMAGWQALEQVFGPVTALKQEPPQAPQAPQPPLPQQPLSPSALPEEALPEGPKPASPPAEAIQAEPEPAPSSSVKPQPVPIPESWRRARERRTQPPAIAPAATGQIQTSLRYPIPPDLPWGVLLVLMLLSCGWVGLVWIFVQSAFVRKLDRANPAIFYFAACAAFSIISWAFLLLPAPEILLPMQPLLLLSWIALALLGILSMRNSLLRHYNELENIGLQLDPALCVLLNVFYFQYHFSQIARLKKKLPPASGGRRPS